MLQQFRKSWMHQKLKAKLHWFPLALVRMNASDIIALYNPESIFSSQAMCWKCVNKFWWCVDSSFVFIYIFILHLFSSFVFKRFIYRMFISIDDLNYSMFVTNDLQHYGMPYWWSYCCSWTHTRCWGVGFAHNWETSRCCRCHTFSSRSSASIT